MTDADAGVYIIAEIDIRDREQYAQYEAGFAPILLRHRGRLLGVDEATESLEGEPLGGRVVIAWFPSRQHALDWFNDPDYQAIAKHRRAASTARFVCRRRFHGWLVGRAAHHGAALVRRR